jgi:acetoin utilization protein AcuC
MQALDRPIVAVGGGGYNLTTVPRMWTLAVATLAGLDLPDDVPASYPHRRDIPALTDHAEIDMDGYYLQQARAFAAQSVEEVKQLLFSRYGLVG